MLNTASYQSPIGKLLLAEKNQALAGLWIEGQKYFLGSHEKEEITENPDSPILIQAKEWLERYFRGEKPSIRELKLSPQGSDFRKAVWQILCEIHYGKVITYKDIAQEIARSRGLAHMSAQAVGGAVAHNPISIIIPCHRVVGTNGSLTGYAGGIPKKIWLLKFEGVAF